MSAKEISHIYGRIYMSGWMAAVDKELLKEIGITHIVKLTGQKGERYPDTFYYINIDIMDSAEQNIFPYLKPANSFI